MVYILSLNMVITLALIAACWWLYREGRSRRMAATAAKLPPGVPWESDMLARVVGLDLRVGTLERAIPVMPMTFSEHAPASARRVSLEAAPPASGAHRAGQAAIGLSRPFQPSPAQVAAARAAHEGARGEQSETPEQIRARLEAAENAREKARARGEAPSVPTLDGDDEDTKVMSGKAARDAVAAATGATPPHKPPTPIAARRAILLGVPPERTAPSYRPRTGSSPTLVSAGVVPPEPPPSSAPRMMSLEHIADLSAEDLARVDALAAAHHVSREAMLAIIAETGLERAEARALTPATPPSGPANDQRRPMLSPPIHRAPAAISVRVERRWHDLLATAQAQGDPAEHCMGSVCLGDGFTVGACPCECEGCELVKDLLARAKREAGQE